MYLPGLDEVAGVVITLYTAGVQTDADYERALADFLRCDAVAAALGIPLVHVVIADPDSEQPPARWRQRFAASAAQMRAKQYYFALVTDSARVRGILTALRWLRGEPAGHHLETFENFERACLWIRLSTGAPYPQLESLLASARARVSSK